VQHRKHVKSDLKPYVCLLEKCSQPLETFSETKAWLLHMETEHKKTIVRWTCNAKHGSPAVFPTEQEFVSHMKEMHPKVASKSQLPIITKRSGKPAAQMFINCPLCGWLPDYNPNQAPTGKEQGEKDPQDEANAIRVKSKLNQHIAEHLQDIALRSLPEEAFPPEQGSIGSVTSLNSSTDSNASDLDITTSEVDFLSEEPFDYSSPRDRLGDISTVTLFDGEPTSRNSEWGRIFTALTKIQLARQELPNPCMSRILVF
jgi:hypothetical protein